jgi:hypothetical protein
VQALELERLGCTHAQGFLFSRPLSIRSAEELLVLNQALGPKRVQPINGVASTPNEPELFFSSKPFEWPDHIQVRPATIQDTTPRAISDLLRA